jgi:hypothetical protein
MNDQSPGVVSIASRGDVEDESRFVGDLNPEGTFLNAASPDTPDAGASSNVGIWHSRTAANTIAKSHHLKDARQDQSIMSNVLLPLLEEQCLKLLPFPDSVDFLTNVYISDIHPIFPVLDVQNFQQMDAETPAKIILSQAICLAASTNCNDLTHLNIASTTSSSPSRKAFTQQLSTAIQTSLHLGLVKDKLILTQVLSILSMFTQFSDDRHSSAELCGRAVAYTQTMGIHAEDCEQRKDHEHLTTLFCGVWALDRLNAAFHGRPILMHERDIGRDLEESFQKQDSCFQTLLRVVMLLDKVIELYRPSATKSGQVWEGEFPCFEDLVQLTGASRIKAQRLGKSTRTVLFVFAVQSTDSRVTATIEALYHAVAMLSCRTPATQQQSRSSSSYTRQSLSASRVTSMFSDENRDEFLILPIIPYAISLSLRVAYRELRFTKIPMFRTRARKQLLTNCTLLRDFGDIFWSTTYMADLAEETVRELDKVCFTIAQSQQERVGNNAGGTSLVTMSNSLDQGQTNNTASNGAAIGTANTNGHSQFGAHASHDAFDSQENGTVPFDPSDFDVMPDFDIFQHFDPNFDLEGIDAALFNLDDFLTG